MDLPVEQRRERSREVLLDHPALGFWSQEPAHVLTVEISNCCFSSQLQAP